MNISEVPPEELLEPSWFETYEKSADALWWQLVRLNSNLLVLERIVFFPFDLFDTGPHHFWRLIENALFESCLMVISRIAIDTDPDVLTLNKLKIEIVGHIKAEYAEPLRATLKPLAFERAIESFRSRIRDIRDNYIAHFNQGRHLRPTPRELLKEDKEILSELKSYTNIANNYFDFLCFGRRKAVLPWGYNSEPSDSLDIDDILFRIARDSPILNAPESNPALWSSIRQGLSLEEIDTLNEYRRKFKLSEI